MTEGDNPVIKPRIKMSYDWVAGFLDADGCVYFHKTSKLWNLFFSNINLEVLEAIKEFLKVKSSITHTRYNHPRWKTHYRLNIYNQRDVLSVAKILVSRSIVKQEKLKRLIEYIESNFIPKSEYFERRGNIY